MDNRIFFRLLVVAALILSALVVAIKNRPVKIKSITPKIIKHV
jgi:hypothetical protein